MQNFCQEAGAIKMQTTYEPDPGCSPSCPVARGLLLLLPLLRHRYRSVRAILENNFKPAARPPTTQTCHCPSPTPRDASAIKCCGVCGSLASHLLPLVASCQLPVPQLEA